MTRRSNVLSPDRLERRQRLHFALANLFRGLLIVTVVMSLLAGNWLNAANALITLILTYIPHFLADRHDIILPPFFQLAILLFLFASMYLGEIQLFFIRFWWWDVVLHITSGMILGIVGFFLLYFLNQKAQIHVELSSGFIAVFAFSFAVTVGVVWEIFEFTVDSLANSNMQKSGLVDTMWDLIVDAGGAAISALVGYFYVKRERYSFFRRFANMIVKQEASA